MLKVTHYGAAPARNAASVRFGPSVYFLVFFFFYTFLVVGSVR